MTLDSKHPFSLRPLAPGGLLMSGRWRGDLTKPEDHLKLSENLRARWYGEGLAFAVQIAAETDGGRVEVDEKGLRVVDALSVTLRLAAATSFRGRDPEAACAEALRATRPYDELLARHMADHRSLYRRVRLDLGSAERNTLPTDERLAAVRGGAVDPGLAATYFQYGRYLLIASSRPGTQPANLQGLWNDDLSPAVGQQVHDQHQHRDELLAGRGDEPRRVPRAAVRPDRGAARAGPAHRAGPLRGARLRRPPQHRPLARARRPSTAPAGACGRWARAWLSTHLFEHYAFGGDAAFLRRAYPVLKEASEFLLDFLVEDEQGRLVTNPSHSPENAFLDEKGNEGVLCVGATMDFGIIRELFGGLPARRRGPRRGRGVPRAARGARSTGCRRTRSGSTGSCRSG